MSNPTPNWQDTVLAIYTPEEDTHQLKAAPDKMRAFLAQRQAHQNRHDFSSYDSSSYDQRTRSLLGQTSN